jgi:hydrogenase-4 component B
MTGALSLACFVKVCGVVFLGAPRSDAAARAHESGPMMRGPMLVLAGACVVLGLAPVLFWPVLAGVAPAWRPDWSDPVAPAPLLMLGNMHLVLAAVAGLAAWWLWRRVNRLGLVRSFTWDCGYARPTARMQYTAGSLAATITEWFAWILRPTVHDQRPEAVLANSASHRTHTPETVLEHIVEPAGGVVMLLSTTVRRRQHGRVQSYLFYLLLGVAVLAAVVLAGGGR